MAVGRYSGLMLLLPVGAATAVWAVVSRVEIRTPKYLLAAIAVQSGHVIWLLTALFISEGRTVLHLIEVVLMTGSLIWLCLSPGIWPVVLLTVWQSLVLLLTVEAFTEATVGTLAHKALLVHIIFRIAAIYLMIVGIKTLQRDAERAVRAA
jgi:hypothetical protein